jgi:taurine--2-oxoglutarate transaminase
MAKGLTSAYVPLGAVGMRRELAERFRERAFSSGLTYSAHPLACATAIAAIGVLEEDKLIPRAKQMGVVMKSLLEDLAARHPCVGAVRSIGLFGNVELVRNRTSREPLAPFGGSSTEMAALGKFFRANGLFTFIRWNSFFTNPPLTIAETEMREGFAIIDRGLAEVDRAIG